MSDERVPGGTVDEIEERAMLEALEALDRDDVSVSSRARAYLETLAALPTALEPVAPSEATRKALMDAVAPGLPSSESGRAESRGGLPVWATRIAAVLALVLLGVTGIQYSRLSTQKARIERQQAEILRLQEELSEILPAADRPPEWMAASGTELCALTPRRAAGGAVVEGEDSKGWLFVRQDHQHWFVAVEGLAPAPEGHVYELWFRVDGEMVSGGAFEPDAEGRASLTSETMPSAVTGIGITLEPDNGDAVPSETMVLWGDEVMLVL